MLKPVFYLEKLLFSSKKLPLFIKTRPRTPWHVGPLKVGLLAINKQPNPPDPWAHQTHGPTNRPTGPPDPRAHQTHRPTRPTGPPDQAPAVYRKIPVYRDWTQIPIPGFLKIKYRYFSGFWYSMSVLKLHAREDAKSHWLHLFDFSPLYLF